MTKLDLTVMSSKESDTEDSKESESGVSSLNDDFDKHNLTHQTLRKKLPTIARIYKFGIK